MNPLERLLGPLATEECRRSVRRNWLLCARGGAAVVATGTVVAVVWYWWTAHRFQGVFLPGELLAGATLVVEIMAITLAVLLGPALVAGAIAGEKDRGTLELLLVSRLSAGEIVAARFVGLLSQVAMIGAAGLPALVLLAALRDATWLEFALLLLVPSAVTLGSGGLALAASTLSRKARNALLAVYLIEIVLFAGSALIPGLAGEAVGRWLRPVNPFAALPGLITGADFVPAVLVVAFWSSIGIAGFVVSSWQLWPAYLRHVGGGAAARRTTRRWRVPPLGARPVLWKELFIERSGSFGWVGRWLGRLLFWSLTGSSVVLLCMLLWAYWTQAPAGTSFGLPNMLAAWIASTATFVLWLLQWAVGLRASAAVSSERQRATWDALLVSPLEGREILWGKTWGSVFALRWLAAAAVVSWVAATLGGAMTLSECCACVGLLVCGGAFMAASGTAVSIGSRSATKGMATTLGIWMAASIATAAAGSILAALLILFVEAARAALWMATSGLNANYSGTPLSLFAYFNEIYVAVRLGLFILATAAVGVYLRTNFDRLAGRMPESSTFLVAERVTEESPKEALDNDATPPAADSPAASIADGAESHEQSLIP